MDDDIDGKPMDMDGDSGNEKNENRPGGFVLSRWETVDPELVEAQAMTTSKWEMLEQQQQRQQEEQQHTINSQDIDSQEESNNSIDNRYVIKRFDLFYLAVNLGLYSLIFQKLTLLWFISYCIMK